MEHWQLTLLKYGATGLGIIGAFAIAAWRKERIVRIRREAMADLERMKNGTLPIILYLRDFDVDQTVETRRIPQRWGQSVETPIETFEINLRNKLRSLGGFYAIRNCIKGDGMAGPSTESFDDDTWQDAVLDKMEKARIILYRPSASNGTYWEFTQIIERGYLHKTIIILVKGMKEPDGSDMYDGFRERVDEYLPGLPPLKYKTTYMWIDKNEVCHITPEITQVPLYSRFMNSVK